MSESATADASSRARRPRPRSVDDARGNDASGRMNASTSNQPTTILEGRLRRPPPRVASTRAIDADARANGEVAELVGGATSRVDGRGVFVGRQKVVEYLTRGGSSGTRVRVLEGDPGSGVSATLGAVIKELRATAEMLVERAEMDGNEGREKMPFIAHARFRGCRAGERDLRHALWVMCEMIRKELGDRAHAGMPSTAAEAGKTLWALVEELSATRTVTVVVDELDSVEGLMDVPVEDWLPSSIPVDVTVIIGAKTKGVAVDYLASAGERAATLTRKRLPPLSMHERVELSRALFETPDEREITSEVFEQVGNNIDASSPTYLYLAAHELRRRVRTMSRRADLPLDVAHEMRQLPETLEQLLAYVFDGLENYHGAEPVRQLITLLLSSRAGLLPDEISDMMRIAKASVSFLALTEDIAHMCWFYEEETRSAAVPTNIIVLRHSPVINYCRRRYLARAGATAIPREATQYFLQKLAESSGGSYDSRVLLEVLHNVRIGAFPTAWDQLVSYVTDPEMIHYLWQQKHVSDLHETWQCAMKPKEGYVGREPIELILSRLGSLNVRTADMCAASIVDFLAWIGADTHVVSVCKIVCSRDTIQQHIVAELNMKYARALRRLGNWEEALDKLKIAYTYKSANFNGNTPLGAIIKSEESLCLARTRSDEITFDNHELFGMRTAVEEAIRVAIDSAESSLSSWHLCMKDRSVRDVLNRVETVNMNVATLYGLMGSREKEIKTHEEIIARLEKTLGTDHIAVHSQTKRLSTVYARHGEWEKAELCIEQALNYSIEMYPESSLELLENLQSLANLYEQKGDLNSASEVFHELIKDVEEVTDANNKPVFNELLANVAGDYARILRKLKKKEEAKNMYIRALDVTRARFGELYHGTADRLGELASMHLELGDVDKAMELYMLALELDTRLLGENHPSLIVREIDLASVFKARGDMKETLRRYAAAESVLRATKEEDFPELAAGLNMVADLYTSHDQWQRAEPLYVRAVSVAENSFVASNNLDVYLTNLARCYKVQGRLQKARTYFENALKAAEAKHRSDTLEIAKLLVDLGEVLMALQLWSDALPYFARAKPIRITKLGPEHLDTLLVIDALNTIMEQLEKAEKSKGKVKIKAANFELLEVPAKYPEDERPRVNDETRKADDKKEKTKRQRPVSESPAQMALNRLEELTKMPDKDPVKVIAPAVAKENVVVRETVPEQYIRAEKPSVPEQTVHANKPSQSIEKQAQKLKLGDVSGFLTEYVEYVGHREYMFKLDGKVFPTFALVREHVEENFADECRLWTRGKFVPTPFATPVVVVKAVKPSHFLREYFDALRAHASEAKLLQKKGTAAEQTQVLPSVQEASIGTTPRVYSKPTVVESPQSESFDALSLDMRQQQEHTPQSKMQDQQVVAANGLVTMPLRERDYMVTKIDSLESELASMREMMQRVLHERDLASRFDLSAPSHGSGYFDRPASQSMNGTGYAVAPPYPFTSYVDSQSAPVSRDPVHSWPSRSFGLEHFPRSKTYSTRPRSEAHPKMRLVRLGDGDRPCPSMRIEAPRRGTLVHVSDDSILEKYLRAHSEEIAPKTFRCAIDGVVVSSETLLRAHFERAHAQDAEAYDRRHQHEHVA